MRIISNAPIFTLLLLLACLVVLSNAFAFPIISSRRNAVRNSLQVARLLVEQPQDAEEDVTADFDFQIDFDDDDDDDSGENDNDEYRETKNKKQQSRWEQLPPKIKESIRKKGQERAIANKKKREPVQEKKRRLMMFVKEQQRAKKKAQKVHRPLAFNDENRVSLSELEIHQELTGTVISLTQFGAYVDVGTECDGLLHVSQLNRTAFVQYPRQLLSPGDEITVRVRSTNPEMKKLHLTMLPLEVLEQEQAEREEAEQRILLTELAVDDELWGELKRVTDFGAYVEVGAQVDGWLHFMEHPTWEVGQHPSEFMTVGDRVRVWVSDVDMERSRLKLTALRPHHLPGPRREFVIG